MSAADGDRTPTPFLPPLEGMRGIAALSVVVYHCWVLTGQAPLGGGPFRDLVSAGFLGVDVFFVLSGFVLFLPVALGGSLGPTIAFWLRRGARLLPAYWVVLALVIAAAPLIVNDPERVFERITPESLLAHLTLMPGLARLIPGYEGAIGFTANPVLWTLTVEALFALILPFVAVACARRPVLLLGGAVLAGLALRWAITLPGADLTRVSEDRLLSLGPPLLSDFGVGMGAVLVWARLGRRGPDGARLAALVVPALVVLVLAAVVAGGADASDVRFDLARSIPLNAIVPLAVGALCAGLVAAPEHGLSRALASRPVRASGRWSYGIYLVHFPLILFCLTTLDLSRDGTTRAWVVMVAVAAPLSAALGAASFRFVEEPVRRWARGRRGPQPATATARS